jgi:hypothetical protein
MSTNERINPIVDVSEMEAFKRAIDAHCGHSTLIGSEQWGELLIPVAEAWPWAHDIHQGVVDSEVKVIGPAGATVKVAVEGVEAVSPANVEKTSGANIGIVKFKIVVTHTVTSDGDFRPSIEPLGYITWVTSVVFIGTKKLTSLESEKAGVTMVGDDRFYYDAVRVAHMCAGADVVSSKDSGATLTEVSDFTKTTGDRSVPKIPTPVVERVMKSAHKEDDSFESLDTAEYPPPGAASPAVAKVDSPVVTDNTITELFAQVTPKATPTPDLSRKRSETGEPYTFGTPRASYHLNNAQSRVIKDKLIKVGKLFNCLPCGSNLKPEFRYTPEATKRMRPFLFTLETERICEGSSMRTLSLTFECEKARSQASVALAKCSKHKSYVYPAYVNFANLEPEVDGLANITVPRKLWVKKSSDPKEMTKAIEIIAAGSQDVWNGLAEGDKQKLTTFACDALKAILEVKESLAE